MVDTNDGWKISEEEDLSIELDKDIVDSLFDGYFREDFWVEVSINRSSNLKRAISFSEERHMFFFGFWSKSRNCLFQIKMMLDEKKKRELTASGKMRFVLDGFPIIFPLAK